MALVAVLCLTACIHENYSSNYSSLERAREAARKQDLSAFRQQLTGQALEEFGTPHGMRLFSEAFDNYNDVHCIEGIYYGEDEHGFLHRILRLKEQCPYKVSELASNMPSCQIADIY